MAQGLEGMVSAMNHRNQIVLLIILRFLCSLTTYAATVAWHLFATAVMALVAPFAFTLAFLKNQFAVRIAQRILGTATIRERVSSSIQAYGWRAHILISVLESQIDLINCLSELKAAVDVAATKKKKLSDVVRRLSTSSDVDALARRTTVGWEVTEAEAERIAFEKAYEFGIKILAAGLDTSKSDARAVVEALEKVLPQVDAMLGQPQRYSPGRVQKKRKRRRKKKLASNAAPAANVVPIFRPKSSQPRTTRRPNA